MNAYGRFITAGALTALVGLAGFGPRAEAQTYPTRTITMIVPFAAGGPTDVIARIVTGHMAQTLGHTIIIENEVGAGAPAATARAARARQWRLSPHPGPYGHACGLCRFIPISPIPRRSISSASDWS